MTISRNRRSLTAAAAVSAVTLLFGAAAFAVDPPVQENPPQTQPTQPPANGDGTAPPPVVGTTPQTGTAVNSTQAPAPNDLITAASKDPSLTTFVRLLREAGLSSTLSGTMSGPYTVFAPSNSAFSRVPAATMAWLERPENRASLATVLKNHIVNGKIMRDNLKQGATPVVLKTLAGTTLPTTYRPQTSLPSIGGANLRGAEIPTDNGVLHEIDTVLLPPSTALSQPSADGTTAPGQPQPTQPMQPPSNTAPPPVAPGGGS